MAAHQYQAPPGNHQPGQPLPPSPNGSRRPKKNWPWWAVGVALAMYALVALVCYYVLHIEILKSSVISFLLSILSGLLTWWVLDGRKNRPVRPITVRRKRHWFWRWTIRLMKFGLIATLLFICYFVYVYVSTPSDLQPPMLNKASIVVAAKNADENVKLGAFYSSRDNNRRVMTDYDSLSQNVVACLLATEDHAYFEHRGVDLKALVRVIRYRGERGGGSTITMQLAKNVFNKRDLSVSGHRWIRKAKRCVILLHNKCKEICIALKLEDRYTKEEILLMYLNAIDWGSGATGIEAASLRYFGIPQSQLSIPQAAMLVGMLQNPTAYNPYLQEELCQKRRNVVLKRASTYVYNNDKTVISASQYRDMAALPLGVIRGSWGQGDITYYLNDVEREMRQNLQGYNIYQDGLVINSTINPRIQDIALNEVKAYMARLNPDLRVGLVIMNPHTGAILGYIGGHDYEKYEFNQVEAMTEPGSLHKLPLYTAYLEEGGDLCDEFEDTPYTVRCEANGGKFPGSRDWIPQNANKVYSGERLPLYMMFRKSKNTCAARVGDILGPQIQKRMLQRGHIDVSSLVGYAPMSIGSYNASLLQMTAFYAMYSNGGVFMDPYHIGLVSNQNGEMVYKHRAQPDRVIGEEITWVMDSALMFNLRGDKRFNGLTCDVGGKTGTSDEQKNLSFIAITPDLVIGATMHYDRGRSVGKNAGDLVLPLVARVLRKLNADREISRKYLHNRRFTRVVTDKALNCGAPIATQAPLVTEDEELDVYHEDDDPAYATPPTETAPPENNGETDADGAGPGTNPSAREEVFRDEMPIPEAKRRAEPNPNVTKDKDVKRQKPTVRKREDRREVKPAPTTDW